MGLRFGGATSLSKTFAEAVAMADKSVDRGSGAGSD
jgi:hypothetical protein